VIPFGSGSYLHHSDAGHSHIHGRCCSSWKNPFPTRGQNHQEYHVWMVVTVATSTAWVGSPVRYQVIDYSYYYLSVVKTQDLGNQNYLVKLFSPFFQIKFLKTFEDSSFHQCWKLRWRGCHSIESGRRCCSSFHTCLQCWNCALYSNKN